MKILITGATGLIGSAFMRHYPEHDYVVWTRNRQRATKSLGAGRIYVESVDELSRLAPVDAVINLAGAPIVGRRWSARRKKELTHSRWQTTKALVDWINSHDQPPKVFLSGSAIGFYGDAGLSVVNEDSQVAAKDFAHHLCAEWEKIALQAAQTTRVACLRTGIVLSEQGGALKQMLPAFRLGLGGPMGQGDQFMSWIHIRDMLAAMSFLLQADDCAGPFNMTAPNPVTNYDFSHELAAVFGKRARLKVPEWGLRLALGEAADLLLFSQNVVPERLHQAGFRFVFPVLEDALSDLLEQTDSLLP